MQLLSNNIKLQDRDSRPAYLELLWVGRTSLTPALLLRYCASYPPAVAVGRGWQW